MSLSIRQLCEQYQTRSDTYYRKPISQRPTGEAQNVRDSHRSLITLYGDLPAADLRVRHLRHLQDYMATGVDQAGRAEAINPVARTTVNARINRIKRMIKWAAEYELAPDDQPHRLAVLSSLKRGRTSAKETPRVMPVPWDEVSATIAAIRGRMQLCRHPRHRTACEKLAVMIELHWHLGCRPGELVIMRKSAVDREGDVWIFTPPEHKTEHHDHDRRIPIGPRAQAVLLPWWVQCQDDVLFAGRSNQLNRLGIEETGPMSTGSYAQAIARTNRLHGLKHWSPNRIRHSAATRFREESGSLDGVQALLGHKNADVTQVYAERNDKAAIALARKSG